MDIKYLKGSLTILASMATPFAAFAMNETSLKAAIVLALVAGISAAHNWLDQAFSSPDSPAVAAPAPMPALPAPAEDLAHSEAHAASQETSPPSPPLAGGTP